MTGGGVHVDYLTSMGLFLSYRDNTPLTICIQNAHYAEDLTLVAETRKELQRMLDVLDRACTQLGRGSVETNLKCSTLENQQETNQPSH